MSEDSEKTEEPTSSKLDEARQKGDVPNSRDFSSFLVFAGIAIAIYFSTRFLLTHSITLFHTYFDFRHVNLEDKQEFANILAAMVKSILLMASPVLIAAVIFGIASSLVQYGFLFTPDKVLPDFERLDPMKGIKKIFSKDTLVELIKSTIKVIVISVILYLVLKGEVPRLLSLGTWPIGQIFLYFFKMIAQVFFAILLFMAVMGLIDLGYQKWSYNQKMMMSFQEIKDEMKQKDGDPQMKARIRQIARDRLRKAMMKDVPDADVVVTNPTHVAVALKYAKGKMRAPIVVAKGAGLLAVRIKEIAALAGVPIVEKKKLARFLYRNVEVGESIPESLYTAVAEVLAYVYKIRNKFKASLLGTSPARAAEVS